MYMAITAGSILHTLNQSTEFESVMLQQLRWVLHTKIIYKLVPSHQSGLVRAVAHKNNLCKDNHTVICNYKLSALSNVLYGVEILPQSR